MSFRQLFNTSVRKPSGKGAMLDAAETTGGTGDTAPATTGAFITPQSLVSFPVASSLVGGLWRLAEALIPSWGGSKATLVVISLVIGLFIWAISVTDPNLKQTRREKFISFGIAVVNSLYLAIAALGIMTTVKAAAG